MVKGERFNSISHIIGATLALIGAVVLVVLALKGGETHRIISFGIYGATLFLLYLISALYHNTVPGVVKHVFRILDRQAIYLLIAGTYTPFALVTLGGRMGWYLFGAVWSMAILGVVIDALPRRGVRVWPYIIYLTMGWLALLVLKPLQAVLPYRGLLWLFIGGLFYTFGIVFIALGRRYPLMHGVWHLFVLAGSICHYVAISVYV